MHLKNQHFLTRNQQHFLKNQPILRNQSFSYARYHFQRNLIDSQLILKPFENV